MGTKFSLERLKELKQQIEGVHWEINGQIASNLIYDLLPLVDEAIARKWVSVKDRLPDDGIPVLVTYVGCNDGKPHSDGVAIWSVKANAHVGMWLWELDRSEAADEITHWMTLPEPPKG